MVFLSRARQDPSICQYVLFIWSIRHPGSYGLLHIYNVRLRIDSIFLDHINLVSDDLQDTLRDIPPSLKVEIRIFVTSSSHPLPSLPLHQATTLDDTDEASPSSSRSHSAEDEFGDEDGEGEGEVEVEDRDEEEEVGGVDEREKLFKPVNGSAGFGSIDSSGSGVVEIQAGRPDIETLLTDTALVTGNGCMSVNGMTPIHSCACALK